MRILRHRVNTLEALATVTPGQGAEVDVRSRDGRLILHHDPHQDGVGVVAFLDAWAARADRGTLVLNPKEDGLEGELLAMLDARRIEDVFFLDLTVPTMVRLVSTGETRVAVRVSSYEPWAAAERFADKARWAWVDCFGGQPLSADTVAQVASAFRVCLVSPELQGADPSAIDVFLPLAVHADAVCTKHPARWRA